ncbi:NAD(P)/FAD-dependent oxidoreductase [Streptomyces sp. TS71-3]|uniref:NAD(P)/FAD-dependent oxidoreductase n=1 Tax=Streptomyces sp. TS71-3 TaxID=2733862 RepID=UPI001B072526|nr:FAD-dependent oxidoreductase [Streptomyces sp. TS71-3]GHJ42074.1 oxidoreductase [Streptomyces sp. TS71-3]
MNEPSARSVDVLVVGAGPAGLAAATRLAARGAGRVLVLDREQQPGGVPRHCEQRGFGPPGRWWTGPEYAARAAEAAVGAGAELSCGTTALGWAGPTTLDTTGPQGPERITARTVVLATGARERPRSARLVPGTRPAGVLTTGELQQTVHLYGQQAGRRAVVVGAEPVAYVALDALRRAGTETVAMVTGLPRSQAHAARAQWARLVGRVPLLTGAEVVEVLGRPRLTGLRLRRHDGRGAVLACDTVVFTGDFTPDQVLARQGGIALDAGTRGPAVDAAFRTSHPGVFAVGSVLHAAESARVAAHEGALAARSVLCHLTGPGRWPTAGATVRVEPPLRWIAPNRLTAGAPTACTFLLRTDRFLARPLLRVSQDGRTLHCERLHRTAVPGRPVPLSGTWTAQVDQEGGAVRVEVD